jgi:hypothetical protein
MVNRFNSDKIKYYKTDSPLAMTDNFNFAASKITGEYVLFIGSDDALCTYGLYFLDKILSITNEKVVRWEPPVYYWPNHILPHQQNQFVISLPKRGVPVVIDSKRNVSEVIGYSADTNHLPMIYLHAAVHKDLLDELISKTGCVFDSISPDYYSGFAVSALVKYFLTIDYPVCIAGISGKSNGAGQFHGNAATSEAVDFNTLNKRFNRVPKGKFQNAGVITYNDNVLVDDFQCAKRNLNVFSDIELDYTKHIRAVIGLCYGKYQYLGNIGRKSFANELAIIKKTIENDDELKSNFDGHGLDILNYDFFEPEYALLHKTTHYDAFCFDASMLDAYDIYQAALLAEKIQYSKKRLDVYAYEFKRYWDKDLLLLERLRGCKRIGLLGAGLHTGQLIKRIVYFINNDIDIVIFDNDKAKWGTFLESREILPPHTIPNHKLDALVISSNKFQEEMYESVKMYGGVVKIIKLYDRLYRGESWFEVIIN